MTEQERYEQIDLPFYRSEIAPILPPKVLDFHTHIYSSDDWKVKPWESENEKGKYVVVGEQYPAEALLADAGLCFPDREYQAVCFGYPMPVADWEKDTAFVAAAGRKHPSLWPLLVAGRDLALSREKYEQTLKEGGFHGFKVMINWLGNDYGDKRVEDMIGPVEMELANELGLIVLLHVPRSGRLADPVVQKGVQWLSKECPRARIVLAHCGRCYMPAEMKAAIGSLRGLDNVWMDTSMVMDPVAVQMALDVVGPERLLYGTDYPVAAMRGRRVRVMDHWVDVVLPGYPKSGFRVSGEDVHATFMAWEIILAIKWAAELAGIEEAKVKAMFWDNGMSLLEGRGEKK